MRTPEIILRNSARCPQCGDEIESRHRHDFRFCRCGAMGVDGGHEYIRRIGAFGENTSIVATRELDDPEATAAALDFMDRFRSGWRPSMSDYADAPRLDSWITHTAVVGRSRVPVLIGTVTSHPDYADATLVATTHLLAIHGREKWARTTRRYYRLGERQR